MNAFLSYILLGFSLAAPIGPVNAAQLDKGMKYGFFNAWLVGLGAMLADAMFMLMIYFGSAHYLQTPVMKTFLWIFGCLMLLYTGIESIRTAGTIVSTNTNKEESGVKSFSSGFFITLSNPVSILFWLGIYGSILAKTAESYSSYEMLIYSSGIFIGLMLWDIAMATMASMFSRFLQGKLLVWISRFAGLSMIGFAVYFGLEALKLLLP